MSTTPPTDEAQTRVAVLNLGFRPFYLLAGVFAIFSIGAWAAQFAGWLPIALFPDAFWHAHEMVFGYALAVIVGFLFTAVRSWTGQRTPERGALAAIAALWLAGRVAALMHSLAFSALADAAFALSAAWGIARPLLVSGNRRNYFFIALVVGLGALDVLFYAAAAGMMDIPLRSLTQTGLDIVLFIIAVMGGRVIPMFTANAVKGSTPTRRRPIEVVALATILALIGADAFGLPAGIIAVIAGVAAAAHAARLALWQPWISAGRPILWILHASYAWIVVHLALRLLAALDVVSASLAAHALTVGAIGGLTLGMMTRTARGHTGRPLAASHMETAAYWLIQLAAAARVFLPLIGPEAYRDAILLSAALWVLAFLLFTVKFWPILFKPRIDGRPG
jgi:uncharacterized protein involved in response to NO